MRSVAAAALEECAGVGGTGEDRGARGWVMMGGRGWGLGRESARAGSFAARNSATLRGTFRPGVRHLMSHNPLAFPNMKWPFGIAKSRGLLFRGAAAKWVACRQKRDLGR